MGKKKKQSAFLLAVLVTGTVWGATVSTHCKYCNSSSYGLGCPYSPFKAHEHIDNDQRCVFCGSKAYGTGCPYSQTKKHEHGSGLEKCIYCGSRSLGSGCPHSPYRVHER